MNTIDPNYEPAELAAKFVNQTSKHVFLTGKAGTGKTTFLKHIIETTHKKAVVIAPTGIAAINAGGVTAHSMFQLPFGSFIPVNQTPAEYNNTFKLNTPASLLQQFKMFDAKRNLLREIELVIIDEVSMLRSDFLDAIDLVLRTVRRNNRVFGGIQMLFIGDLFQLPPIVKDDEWEVMRQFYKSMYFFDAKALQQDKPIYIELEKVYRQSDQRFLELLNNLRDNKVTKEDVALLNQYYKPNFSSSENYITLTTHNYKANSINELHLQSIAKPSFYFDATIEGEFSEYSYPVDMRMELKLGAQVMFIKNDPTGQQRFFNGKIGVITKLNDSSVEVLCEGANFAITVEQYTWENVKYGLKADTNEIEEKIVGTFTHFPIKLAWAITVHKSQGLTFDKAIIDISSAFVSGQVYVALSRLRSLDGLILNSFINYDSVKPDVIVLDYSEQESGALNLVEIAREESRKYLLEFIVNSFDLSKLSRTLRYHIDSYTKDEKKSSKQLYRNWAVKLGEQLAEIEVVTSKFQQQVKRIIDSKDINLVETLRERVKSARDYFSPLILKPIESILDLKGLLNKEKKIKQYLKELTTLEVAFQEQLKQMYKASAMIEAYINNESYTRSANAQPLLIIEKPKEEKAEVSQLGRVRTNKIKDKKEKVDTKLESLKLYQGGNSIEEIATCRNLKRDTIESHLAHYIHSGEVELTDLISQVKFDKIIELAKTVENPYSSVLKAALPENYSYSEIKIALTCLEREKN